MVHIPIDDGHRPFCSVDDILMSIVLMVSVINKFKYIGGGLRYATVV